MYKKIWLSVLMVVLPFVTACALLFILPFDKRFGYYFAKDNCMDQGTLLHDRIYYNDKPVDIALFGSSHTIDGISDYVMEDTLHTMGVDVSVMNMGYCRLGRNMPYVLFKDLLKKKQPKFIVIEVCEKENRDGHMDFAYIADSKDLFLPVFIFNDNLFQDLYKALIVRFEAQKQKWLKQYTPPPIRTEDYGHRTDWSVAPKDVMEDQKESRIKSYKRTTGFARWFYNKYSFNNIDMMLALAQEHNIQVVFLYLPEYASLPVPEEAEYYRSKGRLLIPPDSIYQQALYWKDVQHMNDNGARSLTGWLAGQIVGTLR